MKKLKIYYIKSKFLIFNIILVLSLSKVSFSKDIIFEIKGNDYTDSTVILSILKDIPEILNESYSNDIIKSLSKSKLFQDVSVTIVDDKYIIKVVEYPSINKIYYDKNKRLKDEDLNLIVEQLNLTNNNSISIDLFIKETKKIYQSFGFNDVQINYTEKLLKDTNATDIYFEFIEGEITKINNIFFNGNDSFSAQEIREIINTKTKSLRNIFANNNYKPNNIDNDKFLISKFYRNKGFIDISVETKIEFLKSNKVNIYFDIEEGSQYFLSSILFEDTANILNSEIKDQINFELSNYSNNNTIFSYEQVQDIRKKISTLIIESGLEFFEIKVFDKIIDNKIEILYQINKILPKYTNKIKIIGNNRTFDHVIRRELEIVEGDAIYENQINTLKEQLQSLGIFETVNIKEEKIDNENINLIIEVEEKQTGTFNAGVSVGTIDGFAIVTGLREKNFYGTGRSVEVLVNTSEDRNEFKFITTDRLSYENDADISYKINYRQQDLSTASSYKLDTFSSGIGIGYKLNKNIFHNIDLEYVLKDYLITDSSTVSDTILNSSGANMSYLIKNSLRYSTINKGFIPKNGLYISYNNTFETPSSSSNGYLKNLITLKKFYSRDNDIFSIQTKIGNIFSLNNNDILTDDKFALGGRWLRGFDSYGVGPRNSRNSYIGGNNILAAKLDYSLELTKKSNFPIYLNLFNDYGLIWDNKTKPTNSDNNLRSSAGFGIKYYSPIGPIGFTWGFPIMDEEYDIKRMFLFSIGNID
tara:strand:- start:5000 stop:7270 length:2271 start_codon:yes stop_codon:yes gene_type:complete